MILKRNSVRIDLTYQEHQQLKRAAESIDPPLSMRELARRAILRELAQQPFIDDEDDDDGDDATNDQRVPYKMNPRCLSER